MTSLYLSALSGRTVTMVPCSESSGDADSAGEVGGSGWAEQESFGVPGFSDKRIGFVGADLFVGICYGGIIDPRDDGGLEVFPAFEAMEGMVRLEGDEADGRVAVP